MPAACRSLGGPSGAQYVAAIPDSFYTSFWLTCAVALLLLAWYYWRMDAEQFEILRLLVSSVMPLGTLTFVVLAGDPVRHHHGDRSRPRSAPPAPS
jgi:hypothetical protein